MRKPASLRAAMVAALPRLAEDPDKLRMWIDQGGIAVRATPTLAFEYRYKLNLLLLDFVEDSNAAMVPVLLWLRTEQPDLLGDYAANDKAIAFTVDVLDDKTVDLHLELQLREAVGCKPRIGGGYALTHFPEPALHDGDILSPATLAAIYLDGEDQPMVSAR